MSTISLPRASSRHGGHRRLTGLEIAAAVHAGVLLAATTWAFGGNADWVKTPLALLGSVSLLILLAVVLGNPAVTQARSRSLLPLWPLALFNLLALLSLLTPSFRAMTMDGDILLVPQAVPVWKPSAAVPPNVLPALWLFDAIYLTGFNLTLAVRHRRVLRGLLIFAAGNALVLAAFGTVQKLVHAQGFFFGAVKSPQVFFFSTFIYHNHWGSFIILMSASLLGLIWHYGRRGHSRDFFQSAGFAGLCVLLVLAVSVPLSTSRSCSLLLCLLLGGSFASWLAGRIRRSRDRGDPIILPVVGALAAIAAGAVAIWALDHEIILARLRKTEQQVAVMRAAGTVGDRALLYHNTWRMARDQPVFGWGMDSYPHVFYLYNTQEPNPADHLPIFYHDAHCDWLQSLAEHGFVGSLLLVLTALVPLAAMRRLPWNGAIPRYLIVGCAMILLYALVEFPFGNTAVVLCWWLCFFTALTYARLQPAATEHERSPLHSHPGPE